MKPENEKNMKPRNIIRTPYGTNLQLTKEFGVSPGAVSAALHDKSKSLQALKIRKRARQILKEYND